MKKFLAVLVMSMVLMTACSKGGEPAAKPEEKSEIVVFAAASMTETMEQIKENYEAENENVNIVYTFDSSGTLKTQIQEGAEADLFISAAQKQMNQLDIASDKNEEELDFIDSESRVDLLMNRVTLAVSEGNEKGISGFEDINTDAVEKIALGNADVPVGQYSEEVLTNMGIWDEIQDKVTFGSNVKEVTTWVSEKSVDCGIIYATDAFSAGLEIVAEAPEGTLKNQVVYPAAVLKNSQNAEAAKAFLEYLQTDECAKIFESVGFVMAK